MQSKSSTRKRRAESASVIPFPGGANLPRPTAPRPTPHVHDEEEYQDLYELLVRNPEDTTLLRCSGDNSIAGIRDGDLLLVDSTLLAGLRDAIIVEGDEGQNIVTTYREVGGRPVLGVVTFIIRSTRGGARR